MNRNYSRLNNNYTLRFSKPPRNIARRLYLKTLRRVKRLERGEIGIIIHKKGELETPMLRLSPADTIQLTVAYEDEDTGVIIHKPIEIMITCI